MGFNFKISISVPQCEAKIQQQQQQQRQHTKKTKETMKLNWKAKLSSLKLTVLSLSLSSTVSFAPEYIWGHPKKNISDFQWFACAILLSGNVGCCNLWLSACLLCLFARGPQKMWSWNMVFDQSLIFVGEAGCFWSASNHVTPLKMFRCLSQPSHVSQLLHRWVFRNSK